MSDRNSLFNEIRRLFSIDSRIDPVKFQNLVSAVAPNEAKSIESELALSVNTGGDLRNQTETPMMYIKKELASNTPEWMPGEDFEDYNEDVIPICTYRKMSLDPQIALGMLLIKGFVSTLKYKLKTEDPKVLAVTDYVLGRVHNQIVKEMIDTSFELGFAFFEKVWQSEKVKLVQKNSDGEPYTVYSGEILSLKKVKNLDLEKGYSFYQKAGVDEISYVEQDQTVIGARNLDTAIRIPRHKLVWFALDQKYSNIFGRPRYKIAYESWFYTRKVYNLMLSHLRRTGSPPSFAKFPSGATNIGGKQVDNNTIAEMVLKKLDSQSSIGLPSDPHQNSDKAKWEAGFMEIKNSDPGPYLKVLELLFRQKIAALGIPDSLLVGDAAYSTLDAVVDLLMIMIEDLVEQTENTIRRDLVDYVVEYNFGPEALTSFEYNIDRTGLGRTKLLKDIVVNLIRFNGSQGDLKPIISADLSKIFEEMNIPVSSYENLFRIPEEIKKMKEDEMKLKKDAAKQKSESMLKKAQNQEDTNGVNRVNKTDRSDEGRRTNKENIAE
jgi:hypothetical protein